MKEPYVLGFVAQNENAVLLNSSKALNQHFVERGYSTGVIDLLSPNAGPLLIWYLQSFDVKFCFGYAGIGAHLLLGDRATGQGVSVWQSQKIPFLSLYYDHPFYHPDLHAASSPWVCNCYAFRDFLDVQSNYIKNKQLTCELALSSNAPAMIPEIPWEDRDIPVIFAKTCGDLGPLEESFKSLPEPYLVTMISSIKAAQSDADLVLTELVKNGLASFGIDCTANAKAMEDFAYMVRVLDTYMRHWRSFQFVEKIKHLPVHIVGRGWDQIDQTNAKATFHGPVPANDLRDMFLRSRVILNVHQYGRHVVHERVLQGLEYGANVLTDRNMLVDERLADIPGLYSFDWGNPAWPSCVEESIERAQITLPSPVAARQMILERFPPDATAKQMIELAEKIRLSCTGGGV